MSRVEKVKKYKALVLEQMRFEKKMAQEYGPDNFKNWHELDRKKWNDLVAQKTSLVGEIRSSDIARAQMEALATLDEKFFQQG